MSAWAGFRVDADHETGIGHFMRCLSLARAWKRHGGEANFLSTTRIPGLVNRLPEAGIGRRDIGASYPADLDAVSTAKWLDDHQGAWLVIDGYQFDSEYLRWAQSAGARVLVIDDSVRLPAYHADVLIDQNAGAERRQYPTQVGATTLLGPSYALLAPEYREARESVVAGRSSKRILVTLGGGDPAQQTVRVIRALKGCVTPSITVRVVVGPANEQRDLIEREATNAPGFEILSDPDNMAQQMAWADVAVVSGGTTLWELACVGVPMVVIRIAANQTPGTKALAAAGAALDLGWYENLRESVITNALDGLLEDTELRARMRSNGRALIDGNGADRVVDTLMRISA